MIEFNVCKLNICSGGLRIAKRERANARWQAVMAALAGYICIHVALHILSVTARCSNLPSNAATLVLPVERIA